MESLARSSYSSQIFSSMSRNRGNGFLCLRSIALRSRPQIQMYFLRYPKRVGISFSFWESLQHKTIHPIVKASTLPSSSLDTQIKERDTKTNAEDNESQIREINESKTVHVKFQLQRECLFGQQFLLVGDDPMFGLWNPSNAVPLNWSDGHLWTVELDVPVGKSIKFKFLLKPNTQSILWQPGPDRIIQTWDTRKTIIVCEDWDNAELQQITEEEPTLIENEDAAARTETLIVAEDSNLPAESMMTDTNMVELTAEIITEPTEKPRVDTLTAMVAENISVPEEKSQVGTKDYASPKDGIDLFSHQEVPVLVPGITSSPAAYVEEASTADALFGAGKADELNVPEPELHLRDDNDQDNDNDSPHPEETTEVMISDKQILHENENIEKQQYAVEQDLHHGQSVDNSFLKNDIQWGRRTLQKLLTNMGLFIAST